MKVENSDLLIVLKNPDLQAIFNQFPCKIFAAQNETLLWQNKMLTKEKLAEFKIPERPAIVKVMAPKRFLGLASHVLKLALQNYFSQRHHQTKTSFDQIKMDENLSLIKKGQELESESDPIFFDFLKRFAHLLKAKVATLYSIKNAIALEKNFCVKSLETKGGQNQFQEFSAAQSWVWEDSRFASLVCQSKSYVLSLAIKNHPVLSDYLKDESFDPKSYLGIPLLERGQLIGVLNLYDFEQVVTEEKQREIFQQADGLSLALTDFIQNKELKKSLELKRDLKRFMAESVAQTISKSDSIQVGGEVKNVVCMFVIIHHFEKICRKMHPKKVIYMLNHHYSSLQKVVDEYEGVVDKVLGNCFMVAFNHIKEIPKPGERALECALEILDVARERVGEIWSKCGVQNYSIGIGINEGPAVVGNLGSKDFMDYTLIGDTINTAQRLESMAGPFEIWVNETLVKKFSQNHEFDEPSRREKKVKLKGKKEGINVCVYP